MNAGLDFAERVDPNQRKFRSELVHGGSLTLNAARASRPAVLVLHRGTWCPHCNLSLRTHQRDLVPALDRRGVALIAISPHRHDGGG